MRLTSCYKALRGMCDVAPASHVSSYHSVVSQLAAELGVEEPIDMLEDMDEELVDSLGLKPVPRRRLLRSIAALASCAYPYSCFPMPGV